MELRDSDGGGASEDWAESPAVADDVTGLVAGDAPPDDRPPEAFVAAVADRLDDDPDAAGDAVGHLLTIAADHEGAPRVAAGEALDAIGRRRPSAFEVWADTLATAARDADEEVAFFATRSLAQLAAVNPGAASKGRSAALENLTAPTPDLRQAALSVLAEVGPADPDEVARADRPLAGAFDDDHAGVRTAAAIAAGRLLAAAPSRFPRTANALVDATDDDDADVRQYALLALANFADEHPSNVPRKPEVIEALAGADDDTLGLRRGATAEALAALVSRTFDEDGTTG